MVRDPHAASSSDLVGRNFTVTEPIRLWVIDITEHSTIHPRRPARTELLDGLMGPRRLLIERDQQIIDLVNTTSTALVTGANKGIGKQIARQLAALGFTVYVGSRDLGRGQRAVEEIGGNARALILDVTDAASIASAAGRVEKLDVLVNNAGIMVDAKSVIEEDVESFRRTYETNVFGVIAVTNAFLPALRRSASPRIVNLSSGTGSLAWSTDPGREFAVAGGSAAAYRSSKTALNAVTIFYAQALASEGFKVNALAPGVRATDLNALAAASDGDPAEAATGAIRLALLPDDGPTGAFHSWDGTPVPW